MSVSPKMINYTGPKDPGGLILSNNIFELVNETNVNTKCVHNIVYNKETAEYPLERAICNYMNFDSEGTWLVVVHCFAMGAHLDTAGYMLRYIISREPLVWKRISAIAWKYKRQPPCNDLLEKIYKEIHFVVDEVREDEERGNRHSFILETGVELIKRGARIDVNSLQSRYNTDGWKMLLESAAKGRTAATVVVGVYGKTCYKFPRDILKIIGRIVYESRFEWIDNVESNKKK